jgi:hypothetical protein
VSNQLTGDEAAAIAYRVKTLLGYEAVARRVEIGFGTHWWNEVEVYMPNGSAIPLRDPASADFFIKNNVAARQAAAAHVEARLARRKRMADARAARIAAGKNHWYNDIWDGIYGGLIAT